MNRPILVCALLLTTAAALSAQSPYEGTSTPPPDSTIVTASQPKPPAGQPAAPEATPAAAPAQDQTQTQPAVSANAPDPDAATVAVQPNEPAQPSLKQRDSADPDGDIVHPRALRPGELPEGAEIRVELLDQLSTVSSERGESFRSRVATDVIEGGQVLIPAGAEIDGRISAISSGHPGGRGSMRLRPETIILADGTRYQLHAQLSATPGAKSKVGSEGTVVAGSRFKKDGIEYGGAVGAGVTTGAIVGGPVGAMTGGLIGAGVVTAHLLISHPQARLDPGTVLIFTLSEPLQMAPAAAGGN